MRVGLEDSLYMRRGQLAESNAQQVAKIRRILEELGHQIATPAEARVMLDLKAPQASPSEPDSASCRAFFGLPTIRMIGVQLRFARRRGSRLADAGSCPAKGNAVEALISDSATVELISCMPGRRGQSFEEKPLIGVDIGRDDTQEEIDFAQHDVAFQGLRGTIARLSRTRRDGLVRARTVDPARKYGH